MRTAMINSLTEIARNDKRLAIVTPDMGFSIFEKFRDEFPDRLFNVGIAEQNAVGFSAGLALSGKIVYVYSITPFVTMRPFEQVRIDACYQNLPVKLLGGGGGLSYGPLGPTHHSIEDMAIMRALPNMVVMCPGDPYETERSIELAHSHPGPVYVRLGKSKEPQIHGKKPIFGFGKSVLVKEGKDAMILSTGNMLSNAVSAAELLKAKGLSCGVVSFPFVKPLDKEAVLFFAKKGKAIFTLEEHSIIGGFGSAVAEVLSESQFKVKFMRLGIQDRFCKEVGSQNYLRGLYGLDALSLAKTIEKTLKG